MNGWIRKRAVTRRFGWIGLRDYYRGDYPDEMVANTFDTDSRGDTTINHEVTFSLEPVTLERTQKKPCNCRRVPRLNACYFTWHEASKHPLHRQPATLDRREDQIGIL